ncbi:hypothetical protein MLD38_025097 [Melastoma candidum]|uniref:Uncharacterized protein n=1 Tax=Melastoma candidum TaxID=119954 RepID=A0ACB9NUR2_9MYRT|nr:hypothetical protein MLD38_025097 [Melastoma candidum]
MNSLIISTEISTTLLTLKEDLGVREEGSVSALDREDRADGVQDLEDLGDQDLAVLGGQVSSDREGSSEDASMACAAWCLHASTACVAAGCYKTASVALADRTGLREVRRSDKG